MSEVSSFSPSYDVASSLCQKDMIIDQVLNPAVVASWIWKSGCSCVSRLVHVPGVALGCGTAQMVLFMMAKRLRGAAEAFPIICEGSDHAG